MWIGRKFLLLETYVSLRILTYPYVSFRILIYPYVSLRILTYPYVSLRILTSWLMQFAKKESMFVHIATRKDDRIRIQKKSIAKY